MTAARAWFRPGLAMFGVAWGANQFSSLLSVYRSQAHLSEARVTALFGTYAVGLIPALLVAGPVSDRFGRRGVLRPMLALSIVASLLLVAGSDQEWLLFAGRFLAGVASGAAFGPGSAWVKELSGAGSAGAGARRATVSLSAGFGSGPFVAGLIAQWAPAPEALPYLVHVGLMLVITPLAWNAPETVRPGPARRAGRRMVADLARSAGQPRFLRVVLPAAPWVFALPAVSFTVVPGFVTGHVAGLPTAFAAAITGLTLLSGVLVQPLAARVERTADAGQARGLAAGLLVATAGLGLAATVAVTAQPLLVVPSAVVFGSGYGMLLVSGLREVERLADPAELAGLVAVFYALTYLGFAAPYLAAEIAPHLGYPYLLTAAAAVTLATAVSTAVQTGRRTARRAAAAMPVGDGTLPVRSAAPPRRDG